MERSITNRIGELLSEHDMTQKELAKAAGLTESAVSHYVKGDRVPRGANLIKIARALGTTTDYLLNQDENKSMESDMKVVKTLIARNASKMKKEEKMELMGILLGNDQEIICDYRMNNMKRLKKK